ncbi:hypothetical protein A0128_04775 [Leptospira tipperaryensis]|uniref:Uncharacterized protein n=1 Tax=Leptospira tipperaryensis TaxID=2564040 RepID=A0A1D7UUK4_9LEPT|nr:hypothetical protein [Leptospira tipperaryensis]AOP33221.1 hypothetical protein A0128_04775 [Leptospira tipperaryensis]
MRIHLIIFLFFLWIVPVLSQTKTEDIDEQLVDAVLKRDLQEIQFLLSKGANPNAKKIEHEYHIVDHPSVHCHYNYCSSVRRISSAIEIAIETNQPKVLELLLKPGSSHSRILRLAKDLRRLEMFRYLVKNGVRENGHELENAAHFCDIEYLKILLEEGIRDNGLAEPDTLGSPVIGAASGNCPAALELLISFGYDIDETQPDYKYLNPQPTPKLTPILAAIRNGSVDSYRFLRKKNAKLKAADGIKLIRSLFEPDSYSRLSNKRLKLSEYELHYKEILIDLTELKKIQEASK